MGKLIRDRVPEIVRELGHHIEVRELTPDEYAAALREKLVEEACEAERAGDRAALVEELADLAEVALALARHEGITEAEIQQQRADKSHSHGSFDGRLFSTSYRS
ncbi:nucleoside triphosphate pyrophosphohydrolase [Agreia bicolorata]|uniref:Phosphoribosyl-ATP pyrophosphohydrolase n=1 Tax=Agreia bicolorata TaxID=110935 RepID=A0ABR5CE79_9MICO|nr:nucleoside triphosphate pyrophosphohydrolase [Agreia bicolorata]KJC63950.1 hypothetical protein TZ00_12265 [Agreia bicolorata]